MQEMIICISANLSSQTLADKMNAVKPWRDGRLGAHMPNCVKNSSPHLSFNNATGCHLAFTRAGWWGGHTVPLLTQNRPPSLVSFLAAVSLHCHDTLARQRCKAAICPGICHPNFKYKWDMIPLNLDQIPLSFQKSVTHRWRVWTNTSRTQVVQAL